MSLLSNIKNAFSGMVKWYNDPFPSSEGQFYPLTNTSYRVNHLTRSDYLRLYTGWQYLAVSTIADSVSDLDYGVYQWEEQVEHEDLWLVSYELLQQITSSLQLTGSAYLYKNMIWNKVESLDFLRTDLIRIEENTDGSVMGYRYTHNHKQYLYRPEDVIDISLYSPLKTYPYTVKGVSPMQAVAIQAEMDTTATRWNWNFFKNNASVGWTLETDKVLNKESKKRLISKWKSEFQGVNNGNKMAVLDSWLKYNEHKVSQRELDFVESRRFTRDEVLAIFKIPKIMVGIDENANKATAQTAEKIFYKICISPLSTLIQEKLNEHLFGDFDFQFINVLPTDKERALEEYEKGAITFNEYREIVWHPSLENGDFLKLNPVMINTEEQYEPVKEAPTYSATQTKGVKSREQRAEKIRRQKIARTDKFEIEYTKQLKKIFEDQESMIVQDIIKQKSQKTIEQPSLDLLNTTRRIVALAPLYNDVFVSEGNEALQMIGVSSTFTPWSDFASKWIKDNIKRVALDVDKHTREQVSSIIIQGNEEGLGAEDIAKRVSGKFQDFKTQRAMKIARTEITTASNEATIQSREETGQVEKKERFTALDERVCEHCNAMNGKTTSIREDFLKKGDSVAGFNVDYQNIQWPALHPQCRCTLLPVI